MLLLANSSSHLPASLSSRPAGLQFSSESGPPFNCRTRRAVADVLEHPSRIDVLAQVTSVLPVRHRVPKFVVANLWHGRGFPIIWDITELAQERRTRYADQVANVVTLMTDLDC